MNKKKLLGRLALLTATLIWGSSFYIMKDTVQSIPSSLLLAVRFTIGFLLLSILFVNKWKLFDKKYLLGGFLAGTCLYIAFYTQTIAYLDNNMTAGKSAFLTASYCVMVPFAFWLFNKKKPTVFNLLSAVTCIAGIWLISSGSEQSFTWGDAMTLVCGAFYALHIIVVFNYAKDRDIILLTALQFGFSAILAWLVGVFTEDTTVLLNLSMNQVTILLYLAVFCTTIALLLQNAGQKLVPPAPAAIILSLESVFGLIFAIILPLMFGGIPETLTVKKMIGFVVVFCAVLISEAFPSFFEKRNKT